MYIISLCSVFTVTMTDKLNVYLLIYISKEKILKLHFLQNKKFRLLSSQVGKCLINII